MKPRIVSVTAPNAPVALEEGKIVIRVVAEGTGTLVVGRARHKFKDGLDAMFVVDSAPIIRVEARSLFHKDVKDMSLNIMRAPAIPRAPTTTFAAPVIPTLDVRLDALQPRK
jgi:hypothetical protein